MNLTMSLYSEGSLVREREGARGTDEVSASSGTPTTSAFAAPDDHLREADSWGLTKQITNLTGEPHLRPNVGPGELANEAE
jgi:hypothetical protein